MTDTLDKWLSQAADSLDRRTVERARQNGAMAGLEPKLVLSDEENLAAQAFNRAAVETWVNKTTVDVSTRVNNLANTPGLKAAPGALRTELENLEAEYLKAMPTQAIPEFRLAYNNLTERAVQNAQIKQFDEQMAEARATYQAAERTMVVNLLNAARDGDMEFVEKELGRYTSSLDRNGSVITGGTGVLSASDIVDRKIAIEQQIKTQQMVGQLLRTPDSQKPAFIDGMVSNLYADKTLAPDEKDEVVRDIVQAFDAHSTMQNKAAAEIKAVQKTDAHKLEIDFVQNPTEENFLKLIQHPGFDSSPYQAYTHFTNSVKESNPFTYRQVDTMISEGRYQEAEETLRVTNPETFDQISSEDRTQLLERIVEGRQGGGFQDTEAWKEVVRRINADNSSMSAFGISTLTAEGEAIRRQIYDYMRTEWPKYQRGELKEIPDPIRQYNMKKEAARSTAQESNRSVTISDGTEVAVPSKWVDDPGLYKVELKNNKFLAPRYKDPVFMDYMSELEVNRKGAK